MSTFIGFVSTVVAQIRARWPTREPGRHRLKV